MHGKCWKCDKNAQKFIFKKYNIDKNNNDDIIILKYLTKFK